MRLIFKSVAVLVVLALLLAGGLWFSLYEFRPALPTQQLFVNGRILTMDSDNRVVNALLLEGEQIAAVGDGDRLRALADENAVVIDLKGKTLLPGFIDAHGHFPGTGLAARGVDLSSPPIGSVRRIADLQAQLRQAESALDEGAWLFGFGYDDSLLAEQRHPTREELDAVSATRPIYLMHSSGHLGMSNTAGLKAAGITLDTPDPEGGEIVRDADGMATGLLLEHATDLVAPLAMDFSFFDFITMSDLAAQQYLAAGVTTAQSGGVDTRFLRGLKLLSDLGRIPQRLIVWPLADKSAEDLDSGLLNAESLHTARFDMKAVKLIADGSIQGYTAHLHQPYYRHPDPSFRGFPRLSDQSLTEQLVKYHCEAYQLAIHGNGDEAIESILNAFAEAQQRCPRDDPRAIVVHAQTATPAQLQRMKALGMTPSFFVAHTFFWGDRHRDRFLGLARASRISPLQDALDEDLRFTVHLDSPVVPMDIGRLLWSATTRQTRSGAVLGEEQRVDIWQALRSVTIDAAWQSFEEQRLGSLEVGKQADLVQLDRDPTEGAEALLAFKVERTWIGGRCVYQRGRDDCELTE